MSAYEGNENYIFVSYAHKDKAIVIPIIEALQEANFRVWYDSGIEAGTEWPAYIEKHLLDSAAVLVFMSPSAVASINCRNEINLAMSEKKEMLVVNLQDTELIEGMKLQLSSQQSMFLNNHASPETFLEELFKSKILQCCRIKGKEINISEIHSKKKIKITKYPPKNTASKKHSPKNVVLACTLCMLLLCAALGVFAFINPVTEISVVAPPDADYILYGTNSEELDFQLKSRRIFGGWKSVDTGDVQISGYFSSRLGKQTISVFYEGKTTTFQINVVPINLSAPQIQIQNGQIKIEYDTEHTENLIININGIDYREKPTEKFSLPESFDAGSYTIKVKAVNQSDSINDSAFSNSITIKKLKAVQLKGISESKLLFEPSSESDTYDIYVDGAYLTTTNETEFNLNSIKKVGQHSIAVVTKATNSSTLDSNQSNALSYTMLSNAVSFSVEGEYLTWTPVANATGYELYASGKLIATYGVDIPQVEIPSFYSETGSEVFTVKVLGNGSQYIDSQLSPSYTYDFSELGFVPMTLSTPLLQIQKGQIELKYDTENTENLIIEINGVEYREKLIEVYNLPEEFDAGLYTIRVKAIHQNKYIKDSEFSNTVTIKKLQAVQLKGITENTLFFEESFGSNTYDIYVDGVYLTTVNENKFSLSNITEAGQHSVTVMAKAEDDASLDSKQSEALSFTILSNAISFSADSEYLTWTPIANATGYELYASDKLVSTYGTDIPKLDIISFYSETGSEVFSIKVLGDGSQYIDSSLSATYTHVFPEKYIPLRTVEDLYKLNNSNESFLLIHDIDLSSVSNWTPIENFSGNLLGNGKTIKNLTINASASNVGFFSTLGGSVTNLKFENANITISGSNENIGILCGILRGTVSNISVSGNITAKSSKNVAGIIGNYSYAESITIVDLSNSADVSGKDYVGGIIGHYSNYYNGIFRPAYTVAFNTWKNTGRITGADYVGGMCGYARLYSSNDDTPLYVDNFDNSGDIDGNTYVGGLFGYAQSDSSASLISNSNSKSAITAKAMVGCIAGKLENVGIDSCNNEGSTLNATGYILVGDNKYAYAGGFVGYGCIANNCTNTVDIYYSASGACVGGIMGYSTHVGSVTMSSLSNSANISGKDYIGGIIGHYSNYYNGIFRPAYTVAFNTWKNTGRITGTDYVGGMCGYARLYSNNDDTPLYVDNFDNSGDIDGNTYVGGLLGYASSDSTKSCLTGCTSTGIVSGISNYGNLAGKLENITVE